MTDNKEIKETPQDDKIVIDKTIAEGAGGTKKVKGQEKPYVKWIMLGVAIVLNIWGILSLLQASGIAKIAMVSYLDNVRLIVRYIIVIVTMAAGIMLFSAFAGKLKGKAKNICSIGGCVYSTVLTVPLFLTFIICFFTLGGNYSLPLVGEIAKEFADIFIFKTALVFLYIGGSIMGLIFLAVPILMTVVTVKNIDLIAVLKSRKAVKK